MKTHDLDVATLLSFCGIIGGSNLAGQKNTRYSFRYVILFFILCNENAEE